MKTNTAIKKITRGICEEFAKAFKECELYKLYEKNKDELIICIRNDYLNLYYNCDSIAKIKYQKLGKKIVCEIDKYYLDGNHYKGKGKRYIIDQNEIVNQYDTIKENSDKKGIDENSDNEGAKEKKAQSQLFILNNSNPESKWFCIDVEYVKAFNNQEEKKASGFNGRFDIIALSKNKPHRTALIELKYGSGAIGGKSGIYKHISDFRKFSEQKFFEKHLKQEIIDIIQSYKYLDVEIPFELSELNLTEKPEFYCITLDNNPQKSDGSTPKQTMGGYLFKDKKRWNSKKLSRNCVENKFGDITKKENELHATFLFSTQTLGNIKIADIIEGNYCEKITAE